MLPRRRWSTMCSRASISFIQTAAVEPQSSRQAWTAPPRPTRSSQRRATFFKKIKSANLGRPPRVRCKALKQNLTVKSFVGASENALIWTALIALLLLKWLHHLSQANWSPSNLTSMLPLNLFTWRADSMASQSHGKLRRYFRPPNNERWR